MSELDVGRVVHLEPTVDHSRCHAGTCQPRVICPTCGAATWVAIVRGRWDSTHGYTALPFEPVWVELHCGHTFGDESAAQPGDRP